MKDFRFMFITPKAFDQSRQHFRDFQKMYPHINIVVTDDIYLVNTVWNKEDCDNVIHLSKEFPTKLLAFKNPEPVPPLPVESPEVLD